MRTNRILDAPTPTRAFMEIGVIVAGVLIALGADAWWQAREDRALAEEYRVALLSDLAADSALYELLVGETRWLYEAAEATDSLLWSSVDGQERDPVQVAIWAMWAQHLPFGAKRGGTWQEMVGTGRLDLVGDLELRGALSDYYGVGVALDEKYAEAALVSTVFPVGEALNALYDPGALVRLRYCTILDAGLQDDEMVRQCLAPAVPTDMLTRLRGSSELRSLLYAHAEYTLTMLQGAAGAAGTRQCLSARLADGDWLPGCENAQMMGLRIPTPPAAEAPDPETEDSETEPAEAEDPGGQ